MNTFLCTYVILFPGKLSAIFVILIESMNKINCFLSHCFIFFWEGCASIPFLCFSSLADGIIYPETPKYSEQYFCDQESGTKVNICNFSVFEAVTNFSFIAACSLSILSFILGICHILEMVLQFLYLKNYMQQKFSHWTYLKPFSI